MKPRLQGMETRIHPHPSHIALTNRHRIVCYAEHQAVKEHVAQMHHLHGLLDTKPGLAIRGFKHYIGQAEERSQRNMGHLRSNFEHRIRRSSANRDHPIFAKRLNKDQVLAAAPTLWNHYQWLLMLGRALADMDFSTAAQACAISSLDDRNHFDNTCASLERHDSEVRRMWRNEECQVFQSIGISIVPTHIHLELATAGKGQLVWKIA